MLCRERLEPLAVGPLACDHDLPGGVGGSGGEQKVHALGAVEAADREDEVAVLLAAVVEPLRRRGQHLGVQSDRALQPPCDGGGDREELPRLTEGHAVEPVIMRRDTSTASA